MESGSSIVHVVSPVRQTIDTTPVIHDDVHSEESTADTSHDTSEGGDASFHHTIARTLAQFTPPSLMHGARAPSETRTQQSTIIAPDLDNIIYPHDRHDISSTTVMTAASLPPSLPHPSITSASARAQWLLYIDEMKQSDCMPEADLDRIRSDIVDGISLDFEPHPPPPQIIANTPSVRIHHELVHARLLDYERIHALRRLPSDAPTPTHIQPLHVIIKEGKKPRVVIDLSRNMNDYIPKVSFKYESLRSAVGRSHPGCWYTKLDLSDCFLSFPLHPNLHHLFTFSFAGVLWQFICMAFGLGPAPRICTQLLAVLGFALTRAGINHSRYLDDILLISRTREEAFQHLRTACEIIASLGLVVNASKTVLPTQVITFLGVEINSLTCSVACTPERIAELLKLAGMFRNRTTATHTQLQSLLGKLSFASQVLVGARPFLRSIVDLTYTGHKSSKITLTQNFHDDLDYWCRVLQTWNGTAKWIDEPNPFVISTDASSHGFGVYVEQLPTNLHELYPLLLHSGVAGLWSKSQSSQHIGVLEFFAVLCAAHLYAPLLRNRTLHLYCDNESDVAIICRQSTKSPEILALLRALYALAAQFNFSIRAFHRPGVENIVADYLSRPTKHEFDFARTSSQHINENPLHSVSLIFSRRVQLVPLRQALAHNSLQLSLLSPPSPYASTLSAPTPVNSRSTFDSVASSDTIHSSL